MAFRTTNEVMNNVVDIFDTCLADRRCSDLSVIWSRCEYLVDSGHEICRVLLKVLSCNIILAVAFIIRPADSIHHGCERRCSIGITIWEAITGWSSLKFVLVQRVIDGLRSCWGIDTDCWRGCDTWNSWIDGPVPVWKPESQCSLNISTLLIAGVLFGNGLSSLPQRLLISISETPTITITHNDLTSYRATYGRCQLGKSGLS